MVLKLNYCNVAYFYPLLKFLNLLIEIPFVMINASRSEHL